MPPKLCRDLKVVVLGPAGVGKTSVISCFCNEPFHETTQSTIGPGFCHIPLDFDRVLVNLQIWDTAGEERFHSVTPALMHGANGLILVFDLANPKSFDDLPKYFKMFHDVVQDQSISTTSVLILGNKSDLDHPDFNKELVEGWMAENDVSLFHLVSAKTGDGVLEALRAFVPGLSPSASSDSLRMPNIPAKQSECPC
jgi:small GTP-binding protein